MSQETAGSAEQGSALNRPFWAGYGVAMAVMGVGLPFWTWPPDFTDVFVLLAAVGTFMLLAQPYLGRPVVASMRLHRLAVVHRNTLLVGLFAVLVATHQPPVWAAGVDAVLLAGFLLLMDLVSIPAATLRRLVPPVLVIGLAALIAGSTALVALPASDASYRPILAAVAAAAALAAGVATAFGRAEARRVGSRGTDHQKQDRSPR
ncbi:hypothetical protein [Catenulispora subtropica]|uniref:Uncharacterized protein n=1 Tax=Catenulispora subtropica TaxID=450798 RepID=A0ABN2SYD1_9ACTN